MSFRIFVCLAVSALFMLEVDAFSVTGRAILGRFCTHTTASTLFSAPPPRQPRRMLKKRRRRERKGKRIEAEQIEYEESRPLIASIAKEAGQDYWIDPKDLAKERQREEAIKNRKSLEGEVPKEKLRQEIAAPYKQNWIGYFSVFIAILSVIVIKFPELLDQPSIQIPDL